MRKTMLAWSACAAAVLPALTAGSALAEGSPSATSLQDAAQVAHSVQAAASSATSRQDHPTNTNIQVAILSPGARGGDVEQSNASSAASSAQNANGTSQTGRQVQGGGSGGTAAQQAAQVAANAQLALSRAKSHQDHPSNTNIDVAILSPGARGGDVKQANESEAASSAANANGTQQDADQAQGGGGMLRDGQGSDEQGSDEQGRYDQGRDDGGGSDKGGYDKGRGNGGTGVQGIGQEAGNLQLAGSEATSHQEHPSNTNIGLAILSPGAHGGDVEQENVSEAASSAANTNGTQQDADQTQGGGGRDGTAVQALGQLAGSLQGAGSRADSSQDGASNVNVPAALLGGRYDDGGKDGGCCGREPERRPLEEDFHGGDVEQSNESGAASSATNADETTQDADQTQGGGWGTAVQGIGQAVQNCQVALSEATSKQRHPSNLNLGFGGGDVEQENESDAASSADDRNGTGQDADQHQGFGLVPVELV
jgi:hypothetical protein